MMHSLLILLLLEIFALAYWFGIKIVLVAGLTWTCCGLLLWTNSQTEIVECLVGLLMLPFFLVVFVNLFLFGLSMENAFLWLVRVLPLIMQKLHCQIFHSYSHRSLFSLLSDMDHQMCAYKEEKRILQDKIREKKKREEEQEFVKLFNKVKIDEMNNYRRNFSY
jgi:hypothetical protein